MSRGVTIRRIKFWWNLTQAYAIRYKFPALASVATIFLIVFLISKVWPLLSQKNTLNIGYVGVYSLNTIPTPVLSLVTESLITTDRNGRPLAQLASYWTVSDDGKTYLIFLKDNLKWHDATAVDAKDISIALLGVKITALNNRVIEFKLESPISSFLLALDKPVFKTKSFYGTGQFRIVDIDQKENIVKKISLVPKNKEMPRVNIKFYQTEAQAIHALKIGEIKNVEVTSGQNFASWPTLAVEKEVEDQEIITIFFNNQDPLLSSRELRQALSYAVNRSNFAGRSATSPIAPTSWAYNESVKRYDYNTGKAKELLSKSAIANSKIKLSVLPGLEDVAGQVKQDWQAIGVGTELTVIKTVPESFQALLARDKLSPDPDQYAMWHSTQSATNITQYKDVKIDKLLEDARSEKKEDVRRELYYDFQKFLMEDAPAVFLYHPYKYKITYKNAKSQIEKLPK
ncbi:ABC transporter substrate-binding protein [Candidatus Curtissbacteria bacterium]|nr:ABC transporter substrate-binding protein [Candidatus Curtissbacteria bacterium]